MERRPEPTSRRRAILRHALQRVRRLLDLRVGRAVLVVRVVLDVRRDESRAEYERRLEHVLRNDEY